MSMARPPRSQYVEHLLRNAQLRDELEPYMDESILSVDTSFLPLDKENEFLESMLAWERAPAMPVAQWFEPPLLLPHPRQLSDARIHQVLSDTIRKLFDKQIVLERTDHLSDRELYTTIFRDILPSYEKKIDFERDYLRWECVDQVNDPKTWLTFYATDDERSNWALLNGVDPPLRRVAPYPRVLPGHEL